MFRICAWCHHSIKSDDHRGYKVSERFLTYLRDHDALVTHGICRECKAEVDYEYDIRTRSGYSQV